MTDGAVEWPEDVLRWRAKRTPDRLALVDGDSGRRWTYAEFDDAVDRVAIALDDAGVEPGETVATLLGTRLLSIALPFAAVRRGVTLAPLNTGMDAEALGTQSDRLDPALLLCASKTATLASDCTDAIVASVDASTGDDATQRFVDPTADRDRPDETQSVRDRQSLAPDDTALVAFTSGTTGRPKGVRLTMANLLSSAAASAHRLGVSPRDRWFSPLSTYHVGGIAPYVRAALYGTAVVFQREFDPERAANALADRDATCASFVPTMLSRVLDAGWRPASDFRFVLLGGGPAPDTLLERCRDLEVPVCPTYGATETASQVATATPGEARENPGTVGRPLVDATVRVVDDGRECERGEVGELVVEGPMVSPGYLDPDATAQAFDEDGRFATGDLGSRDANGRLRIVGRADDVIVTGGENVRPAVVVECLESHSAVEEAAVVGVTDDEWGERVVALVVAEGAVGAEDGVDATELRAFCRGEVPEFAVPKSIAFAGDLPRTPSGTIDREAVRERFRSVE